MKIRIKRLSPEAFLPEYAHGPEEDAGLDLRAMEAATLALLEILAAAILSANLNFLLFLAFYLLSAIAAFTSAEIRRAMQKPHRIARGGQRRFHGRLAALSACVTAGILVLTGALFFKQGVNLRRQDGCRIPKPPAEIAGHGDGDFTQLPVGLDPKKCGLGCDRHTP